jgi:beta-mannanase
LGHAVIRLAHEANDTGSPYALGTSVTDLGLWRAFWRRTVLAMRSVPGAHFLFDWCINAYWRPIPLQEWYPGDDVVDIIGIDAYDSGVPMGQNRWTRIYNQRDGIGTVLRFAAAHGKPVSVPEWGLSPAGGNSLGGGDDPHYVDQMAGVVRTNPVAYQAYFFSQASGALLFTSPASLSAYRRHFGAGGDATGSPTVGS